MKRYALIFGLLAAAVAFGASRGVVAELFTDAY